MSRFLYRLILLLHPAGFRRRFGAEMLCIYEEARAGGTAGALFLDVFLSLARQWCLRSGSWKVALALVGACLQVGFGLIASARPRLAPAQAVRAATGPPVALADLVQLTLWASGCLALLVILITLWFRNFAQKTARS
jgi:hypothetical protein